MSLSGFRSGHKKYRRTVYCITKKYNERHGTDEWMTCGFTAFSTVFQSWDGDNEKCVQR